MPAAPRKKGLTLRTIQTLVRAAEPGMWSHERGLCLAVAKSGSAFWALRYSTKSGKRRLMTLETYEPIDAAKLKALEWQVAEHRKQIKAERDPLTERNAAANKMPATTISLATADTFEDVARDYIAQHKDGWKNPKHRQQWENTLATYVYRIIGRSSPHEITTNDVLGILQQKHVRKGKTGTLWTNARETASRVRSRIETVIAAAKAKGLALTDLMAWLYREMPNANFIAFGRRLLNSSPIRRSFLNWCGQHFDVRGEDAYYCRKVRDAHPVEFAELRAEWSERLN
jgi:hypothetical protein